MIEQLGWRSLQKRRIVADLKLFYQIYNGHVGIERDSYISESNYVSSRTNNSCKVKTSFCRTDQFKHSFFPRASLAWNGLPDEVVRQSDALSFIRRLDKLV